MNKRDARQVRALERLEKRWDGVTETLWDGTTERYLPFHARQELSTLRSKVGNIRFNRQSEYIYKDVK